MRELFNGLVPHKVVTHQDDIDAPTPVCIATIDDILRNGPTSDGTQARAREVTLASKCMHHSQGPPRAQAPVCLNVAGGVGETFYANIDL
jgi:hypothetical protein